MSVHSDKSLPVLSTLAKEFLVFDKWHASVPGLCENIIIGLVVDSESIVC
jgi:hypothetical protein